MTKFVEVGAGFWNIRTPFRVIGGLFDVGTHMSIIALSNRKFLLLDTVSLDPQTKKFIDDLTENGTQIEAVVATHPFHTIFFPAFYAAYPNVPFYGTPRHIRNQKMINWAGDVNDCAVRMKWSPEVEMRIPNGAEFVAPVPEYINHFSSVFVFHRQSRTLHVDDTISFAEHPGCIMRMLGAYPGYMAISPVIKIGLFPTPEAPYQFRDFMRGIINDWDFDNLCAAHNGIKIGGAKAQLTTVIENAGPLFDSLSQKFKKNKKQINPEHAHNVTGNDCG